MSSPRNRRDYQIRNKQMEVSIQTHTKCLDKSPGIASSEESAHKNISNTKSPKCDCGFIKLGQAIAQEMSLRAKAFQLMQWWTLQLEIDMMTSLKNRKTKKFVRPSHHPDYAISCFNSEPLRKRTG